MSIAVPFLQILSLYYSINNKKTITIADIMVSATHVKHVR